MASKKAGRLAGLAALAGLAYMNKDKLFGAKDKTSDTVKSENKSESKSNFECVFIRFSLVQKRWLGFVPCQR
jgi:uncharacterized membrane protein YebE (DUF533 family)